MTDFGSMLTPITGYFTKNGPMIVWGTVGIFALLIILAAVMIYRWNSTRWNIRVEFKLTRQDGKIVNAEWGKGSYQRSGRIVLKRKGIKAYQMKPFDVKKYLQGDILTVTQLGVDDWLPVLPYSYTRVVDDETGEVASIMKIKANSIVNKTWKNSLERDMKGAFSIQGILNQYQLPIAIGLVLICNFVGFAILWGRLPAVCK